MRMHPSQLTLPAAAVRTLAWYYLETNPAMSLMGRTTLERILADSRTMNA